MKRSTTVLASVAIILGGAATVEILDGGDAGAIILEHGASSSNQQAGPGSTQR
ncbi:hypothetical protein NBRGN_030_00470 [Nocardia brasiliensis NBRC 14402]|uniref:hypothetical protein n=1 Tax=Nocardia brasiliensis TaxID=37326 RepID=UPI0002FC6CD7|nr:hypothetical protein [Nocardia brasiliensis]GAJ80751.1 hypothetical protein NBRGN_030_00470 [Nocardia brasiliensis NBRC 14402]SUB53674.1 Uncharacterised protein [Nocardia brasiliensis]